MDDFELFVCQLLVEDSVWLDDFQSGILRPQTEQFACIADVTDGCSLVTGQGELHESKVADKFRLVTAHSDENGANDIKTSAANCPHSSLAGNRVADFDTRDRLGVMNRPHLDVDSATLDILPAPEFVHGSQSCVASDTFRLLKRSASFQLSDVASRTIEGNIRLKKSRSYCDPAEMRATSSVAFLPQARPLFDFSSLV